MIINPSYEDFIKDTKRYILLYGGSGSAKSYSATQKLVMRIMSETPHKIAVIRRYGTTLKYSAFDLFKQVINDAKLNDYFVSTVAPLEIRCTLNENSVIFLGMDDESKIKSIAGITAIFCEEATDLLENQFKQIDLRLRGDYGNYKQIILAFNPIDERSWINQNFFKKKIYFDVSYYHTTYKDNQFIDDDYRQTLINNGKNDKLFSKVYLKGEWGSRTEHTIFTKWEVDRNISTKFSDYDNILTGVDFGYAHPSVALSLSMKEDEIKVFNEIYLKHKTTDKLINAILDIIPRDLILTCDSANPEKIEEMRNSGLRAYGAKKGNNSVIAGIDWLKRKKIKVHPSCANTIKELENYKYRFDERTKTLFEEPVPIDDDCISCIRYATEPIRLIKQVKATRHLYR